MLTHVCPRKIVRELSDGGSVGVKTSQNPKACPDEIKHHSFSCCVGVGSAELNIFFGLESRPQSFNELLGLSSCGA